MVEVVGGAGGVASKGLKMGTTLMQQIPRGAGVGAGFSSIAPVASDDYWDTKQDQVTIGTLLGGGLPLVGKALSGAYEGARTVGSTLHGKIRPVFEEVDTTIGRVLKNAIPDGKRAQVVSLLRENKKPYGQANAGEVTSPAGVPVLADMQNVASRAAKQNSWDDLAAQRAARKEVLDDLSGTRIMPGRTANEQTVAINTRNAETAGMRENALRSAEQNTRKAGEIAQRIDDLTSVSDDIPGGTPIKSVADAVRGRARIEDDISKATNNSKNVTTPWGAKIPPRYAPHQNMLDDAGEFLDDAKAIEAFKKFELQEATAVRDSMQAYGIKPLTADGVNARLNRIYNDPETGVAAKQVLRKIMTAVKNEADDTGAIDPVRLYRMRKLDLQQTVDRLFGKEGSSQHQASLVKGAQKAIDDAIEEASGGGWKAYLKKFAEMSRGIDKMKMAEKLRSTLFPGGSSTQRSASEKSARYSKEVSKPEEQGARSVFGKDWGKVKGLEDDLARSKDYEILAGHGSGSGAISVTDPALPNALWREIMVTNNVLRSLGGVKEQKMLARVGELMRADPDRGFAELADLIERLPPEQRSQFMGVIAQHAPELNSMIGGGSTGWLKY